MITALEILFFLRMDHLFSILAMSHLGSWVPDKGPKLHHLHWKHRALTTGSLGKSRSHLFQKLKILLMENGLAFGCGLGQGDLVSGIAFPGEGWGPEPLG